MKKISFLIVLFLLLVCGYSNLQANIDRTIECNLVFVDKINEFQHYSLMKRSENISQDLDTEFVEEENTTGIFF